MLCITVAQDGSGDFASISEAVLAVPYDCPAQIRIGAGIYREKLVCEKKDIALQGAGADCTRLVWGDGGKLPHPDGRPTHTFRSYTAFFSGERLRVEDLTIENDAGPGAAAKRNRTENTCRNKELTRFAWMNTAMHPSNGLAQKNRRKAGTFRRRNGQKTGAAFAAGTLNSK